MQKPKKLSLRTETIRPLQTEQLAVVVGGSVSVYNPSGGITSLNPSGGIPSLNTSMVTISRNPSGG